MLKWVAGSILAVGALLVCTLEWGGYWLIASDTLPEHVDAAIVLQGSTLGEKARVAGAMKLVQLGVTEQILLSIPPTAYWDEPTQPVAYAYLERNYGREAAQKVQFCTVAASVNSTDGEARSLESCIRDNGWKSIALVTSSYHSRRAGILWRRMLRGEHSNLHLWVQGVPDPEFQPQGWWRQRLYAKTWFFEFTKLIWESVFG